MSSILDALKRLEVERAQTASRTVRLDLARFEQFLELQRDLLLATDHPERLPDRLVQALSVFLRLAGAAVGVVQDGMYRILATYGLGKECWAADDRVAVRDSRLTPALIARGPVVLRREIPKRGLVADLTLPFPSPGAGALHLIAAEGVVWRDEDILEARALAVLVGVALVNAGVCPRSHESATRL
jgi:hypothetical protein